MVRTPVPSHGRIESIEFIAVTITEINAAPADPRGSVQQRRSGKLNDRLPERRSKNSFDFGRLLYHYGASL
jgi:hypothetical protein